MAGKKKFLVGAFLGAAAGAVAGVLLAPKSGKETREDLAEKAEELKTMTPEEIKEKAIEKAHEFKDIAVEKAEELKEKAAHSLDDAKVHLENLDFNEVRQSMEEKRHDIANKIKHSAEHVGETLTVDELASTSPVVKTISEDSEEEELASFTVEPVVVVADAEPEAAGEAEKKTDVVVEESTETLPDEEDLRETLTKKVNEFKLRVGQQD
ncbi:MAG: YtxH domain-containing protein [Culicoidibacterales bacterium]